MTEHRKHSKHWTARCTWLIPILAVGLYTFLSCLTFIMVSISNDGEAVMAWYLFVLFDWPASNLFTSDKPINGIRFLIDVLVFGGSQWFVIGTVVGYVESFFANSESP